MSAYRPAHVVADVPSSGTRLPLQT